MSHYHLSAAQDQFAQEHHATPGGHPFGNDRMLFMYRRDTQGTHRWLVDEVGRIFDSAWFLEQRSVPE
jgi:hypothetical protein